MRTKVTPVNPQSVAQQQARLYLTNFSQAWRSLTQAQRDAWNAVVADFAKTDIFGDLRNPTGKNLYSRLNINLLNAVQTPIQDPPLPSEVQSYQVTTLTISEGGSQMDLAFGGTDANTTIIIEATAPLSAGVGFFKNRYRIIGTAGGTTASPLDLWAPYVAKFGAPAEGTKISIRLYGVNHDTGLTSQRSAIDAIVAA